MCNGIDFICTMPETCGGQCWKYGRRVSSCGGDHSEETAHERVQKYRQTLKEECIKKFASRLPKKRTLLLNWQYNHDTLKVEILEDNERYGCPQIVASSWLEEMPGCCAVLVSRNNSVLHSKQRCGLGSLMQEIKIWLRDEMNYSSLICIVAGHNEAENRLLEKFGWVPHSSAFTNPKTNNEVRVWVNCK